MTFYIFLYILLLLGSFADASKSLRKNRIGILLFFVFVFVSFRGLRWETGTDWEQFYVCFENANWDNIMSYDRYGDGRERMEMGYMFLNCFIKLFGDYTLFLLVTNFFLVGTWAYMSYKLVPQKFLMTFAMIMVSNLFFPVRLQLAAGVFCWALYYLYEKKWIRFVLSWVIACFIHKSCILVILFVPILLWKINSFIMIILMFGTFFSSYIADKLSLLILGVSLLFAPYYPDLANNLEVYSNSEISGMQEISFFSQIISFLFSMFLIGIFLYARKLMGERSCFDEKMKVKVDYNIYLNAFFLFTVILKFFSVPMLSNFQRIASYFSIGYAIYFMVTFEVLKKKLSSKVLFFFYILLYLYKLKGLLNTPYPEMMYPYVSIFDINGR